jgi:hypothetical protein
MDEPLRDARLQQIYDSTPLDEPRSKLEPYRELILLWRRQRRTYRRIRELLSEKCGLRVSTAMVHKFVRSRARPRKEEDLELISQPDQIRTPTAPQVKPLPTLEQQNKIVDTSEGIRRPRAELVAQRDAIRAAHNQPVAAQPETEQVFIFDPNKPLVNKNYGG